MSDICELGLELTRLAVADIEMTEAHREHWRIEDFDLNRFVGFIPGNIEGCMFEDGIISLLHLDPHRLKKEILDAERETFDFDLLKLIFLRLGSSESAKTVSHFLMGLFSS